VLGNILETLDKLVVGLLDYVYSMLDSFWLLLLFPVRSPVQLAARFRDKRQVQISGLMILVLSYGLIFAMVVPAISALGAMFTSSNAVPGLSADDFLPDKQGSFGIVAALPYFLGGFVSAVLVDAANRLVLLALRTRRQRGRLLRLILQYAAAPLPIAICTGTIAVAAAGVLFRLISEDSSDVAVYLFGAAWLVLLIRAGLAGGRNFARVASRHAPRLRYRLSIAFFTALSLAFPVPAYVAGFKISSAVAERMNAQESPELVYSDCRIEGADGVATLVFTTDHSKPQSINLSGWRIRLSYVGHPAGAEVADLYFQPEAGQAPVAEPDRAVTLSDRFPVPEGYRDGRAQCTVDPA